MQNFAFQLLPLFVLVLFTTNLAASLTAQEPEPGGAPVLAEIVDQVVDVKLSDGTLVGNVTVSEASEGKLENSLRGIKVQSPASKKTVTLSANKIEEIFVDEVPLDVSYDKKNRCLIHSEEKRTERLEHRRLVEERLSATRDRFWKPLTAEEQEEYMDKHRAFIKKIEETMSGVPFRLVETNYFLFLTDLAPAEVDGYIVYLDAMYRELCKAFGLSPDKNIWCGKCVVIAFRGEQDYHRFEAAVMNNANSQGTQGLCHQSKDGTVVFAGFKGTNDFFGHVLVHETSHGFVHRYMTTARAPSWLNEGMSDWLAAVVVGRKSIALRQKQSAVAFAQAGGWGDFLTVDRISGDQYGTASTVVEILLAMDKGGKFREFFDSIKEGKPADESLKDSFGISYQDLQILYAQQITKLR